MAKNKEVEEGNEPKKLTPMQEAFCQHYANCLNATEAARRAGYSDKSENGLALTGMYNLRKPNIKARIADLIEPVIMPPSEVLLRMSQHARASIMDCFDIDEQGVPRLNLAKAQAMDAAHLIKSIRYSQKTDAYTVEMFDQARALEQLAKYHQLLTDKVKHDGVIEVVVRRVGNNGDV